MNFHNLRTIQFQGHANDKIEKEVNNIPQKNQMRTLYRIKNLEGKSPTKREYIEAKGGSHKLNISRSHVLQKGRRLQNT